MREVNGHGDNGRAELCAEMPSSLLQQREGRVKVSVVSFHLDRISADSVTNFAGIDIMTIAYKKAGERGGGRGESSNRRSDRSIFIFGRFIGDF